MAFPALFMALLESPDLAWIFFIALLFLIIAFAGYMFYNPLPEGAGEPWKQMTVRNMFTAVKYEAKFLGKLRCFGTERQISRWLSSKMIYYLNVRLFDFSVTYERAVFDDADVRIYRPRGTKDDILPGLIYFHGGGWVSLDLDCYDAYLRCLCKQSNMVICAVEPRKAPETLFPEPYFDCLEAAVYFMKNARKYGVDPTRIGALGDSAGGNLAAAVAIKLAEQHVVDGLPRLKALGLIYPALQCINLKTPSYEMTADPYGPYVLTKEGMVEFWVLYSLGDTSHVDMFLENKHTTRAMKTSKLGRMVEESNLPLQYRAGIQTTVLQTREEEAFAERFKYTVSNPEFCPMAASDEELRSLPMTYLLTTEFDVLRDDGFLFAKRLKDLRVPFEHMHWDEMEHGFLLWQWYKATKQSIDDTANFFIRNL